MTRRDSPLRVSTMLMGTGTEKRQTRLKKVYGLDQAFSMKRSGTRYLVYVEDHWVGELPTLAAQACCAADDSGVEVGLKMAKVVQVPYALADARRAAFELFDRHESDAPKKVFGVLVVVEIGKANEVRGLLR